MPWIEVLSIPRNFMGTRPCRGVSLAPLGKTGARGFALIVDLPAVLRPDLRYEIVVANPGSEAEILGFFDSNRQSWVMARAEVPSPVGLEGAETGRQRLRFQDYLPVDATSRRFMQLRVVSLVP